MPVDAETASLRRVGMDDKETRSVKSTEEELITFIGWEFLADQLEMTLTPDTRLLDEGIVDSVGVLHLVQFIEQQFQIVVPYEDLLPRNFGSVSLLAKYITSRRSRGHD